MEFRKYFILHWLLVLLVPLILLSGCGRLSDNPMHYYSGYYKCNWTTDGKIIASKQVVQKQVVVSDSHESGVHYIVKIDPSNFVSENVVFSEDIWNYYVKKPSKIWDSVDALALCNVLDGTKTFVDCTDANDYQGKGVRKLKLYENDRFKNAIVIPWQDPDLIIGVASKETLQCNKQMTYLLLSAANQRFAIYDLDCNLITEQKTGGYAIWKDNKTILFYKESESKLAEYSIESHSEKIYPVSFRAEYYNVTENAAYQIENGNLKKCNLDTMAVTVIKKVNYDFVKFDDHSFSPDGKTLLLSSYGFFSFDKVSLGIYTYNLQTDVLTKIRD